MNLLIGCQKISECETVGYETLPLRTLTCTSKQDTKKLFLPYKPLPIILGFSPFWTVIAPSMTVKTNICQSHIIATEMIKKCVDYDSKRSYVLRTTSFSQIQFFP